MELENNVCRDNMSVEIRQMTLNDVFPLMRMLLSLSKEDRKFFHPLPFKVWKLLPLLFYMSISNKVVNYFRILFPKLVFLSLISVNMQKQITGFAYLKFLNKLPDGSYTARLDHIIVFKDHRNMGIGSRLMNELISLTRINNIKKITLTVRSENESAIRLYQKFGFETKNVTKNKEVWNEKFYSNYDMKLILEKMMEN